MSRTRFCASLATAVVAALLGSVALRPQVADAQQTGFAPIERLTRVSIVPANRIKTPKAHWGIYALAEYTYSQTGKPGPVTKKKELIVEEDMWVGNGANRADVKLKSGEYEIQVQPDHSRLIVKRFLVNNHAAGIVPVDFIVEPIEDDAERAKTEFVHIGPPLSDLEERVTALEKKAGIAGKGGL